MVNSRIVRVIFWSYAVAWTVLLLVPYPAELFFVRQVTPKAIVNHRESWETVVHVTGYFGLTILSLAAYAAWPAAGRLRWLVGACVVHGALTEIGQAFVPPRQADVADWIADISGVTLATVLFTVFHRVAQSARRTPEGSS